MPWVKSEDNKEFFYIKDFFIGEVSWNSDRNKFYFKIQNTDFEPEPTLEQAKFKVELSAFLKADTGYKVQ